MLNECLSLNRSDFDIALTCVGVCRGRSVRKVKLDGPTSVALAEYLMGCPFTVEGDAPVFVGTRGERLLARLVQLSVERFRNRLALHENATARSLRGAAIFRMRQEGTSDVEILRCTGLKSTTHLAHRIAEMPPDFRVLEDMTNKARRLLVPRGTAVTASIREEQSAGNPGGNIEGLATTSFTGKGKLLPVRVKAGDDPHIVRFIGQLSPSKSNYAAAIRHFAAFLNSRGRWVASATRQDIIDFETQRASRYSHCTIILGRRAISQLYKFLFRHGEVRRVPTVGLPPLLPPNKAMVAAPAVVVQKWINALEAHIKRGSRSKRKTADRTKWRTAERAAALVAILSLEGLKLREALGLRNNVAAIRKAKPSYCEYTIAALTRVEQSNDGSGSFLFQGYNPTRPVTRQHARRWLMAMADELGLPRLPPESFTQGFRCAYLAVHRDVHALAKVIGRGSGGSLSYQFRDR
jgi:integrase